MKWLNFSVSEAEGSRLILVDARSVGQEISEDRLREFISDLQELLLNGMTVGQEI